MFRKINLLAIALVSVWGFTCFIPDACAKDGVRLWDSMPDEQNITDNTPAGTPAGYVTLSEDEVRKKEPQYVEGEVLVKFKKGVSISAVNTIMGDFSKMSMDVSAGNLKEFEVISAALGKKCLLFRSHGHTTAELIDAFSKSPDVESVSANHILSIYDYVPDDKYFEHQWGFLNTGQRIQGEGGTPGADIKATQAWERGTGSEEVVVAVQDTGVDYTHPEIKPNMWENALEVNGEPGVDDDGNGYVDDFYGIDVCDAEGDPWDDHGHGTHMAGVIAAVGDNGMGVSGITWNTKIMALKFLSMFGYGSQSTLFDTFEYVLTMKQRGVNIVAINASWGGATYDELMEDIIAVMGDLGVVFVAAAGNDGWDNDPRYERDPRTMYGYPVCFNAPNLIAVAATDNNDDMAYFSSHGPTTVDLGAPGVNIVSTLPKKRIFGMYRFWSGTSCATPHVTGTVALLAAMYPEEDIYSRIARILSSVDEIPALSGYVSTNGRLNLERATDPDLTLYPYVTDMEVAEDARTLTLKGFYFGSQGRVVFEEFAFNEPAPMEGNVISWSENEVVVEKPKYSGRYLNIVLPDGRRSNRQVHEVTLCRRKAGMAVRRDSAAAALLDGMIYRFGGFSNGADMGDIKEWEVYDLAADVWARGDSYMLDSRGNSAAAAAGGKIYIIGGYKTTFAHCGDEHLSSVEVFDPETGSFTYGTEMPEGLCFHEAASMNGKIYVTGGMRDYGDQFVNTLYQYDPVMDEWKELQGMSTPRGEHGCVALDGKIYVFGGTADYNDHNAYLASGEVYDPAADTWSPIADMPMPLARMGAAADGRYIYALGGTNGKCRSLSDAFWYNCMNVVWRYDPQSDSWQGLGERHLLTHRLAAPAIFVEGYGLYSIGGFSYSNSLPYVDFLPLAEMNADGNIVHSANDGDGDMDGDGDVDGSDLAAFAQCWVEFGNLPAIAGPPPCDLNMDGDVDHADLAIFAEDFGRTNLPLP